jgi:hypothetical protein
MLVSNQKRNEMLLFQDLYFIQKPASIKTAVTEALCDICKKGLEDGLSVTAIPVDKKIRLYCDSHFPKYSILGL